MDNLFYFSYWYPNINYNLTNLYKKQDQATWLLQMDESFTLLLLLTSAFKNVVGS